MKAAQFIQVVRKDMQELWDMHELSLATDGMQGCPCLNPEYLTAQMGRSDREILEHYLALGAEIEDAEAFLSSQN